MKTIHKFILKSYLGPMVLTFFIVMFVLMMNVLWRYIDELVGKGLGLTVILELMFYASANMISLGLPLSTLFAAIMTMGNMGENYELLAMKSSGMSLPRILQPMLVVVFFISVGSFFVANNFVPYSFKKSQALLYDIRHQKQTIEFQDGMFFDGVDDMVIRIDHQDPQTGLLTGVLIYDTSDGSGNMTTTMAESGYIRLSDDRKFLLVKLFNGEMYEETRNTNWYAKSELRHHIFSEENLTIPMSGFDFERTDSDLFNNSQTKNVVQLDRGIDSLSIAASERSVKSYEPLLTSHIFSEDHSLIIDSLRKEYPRTAVSLLDSIESLDVYGRRNILATASSLAKNSRSMVSFDETAAKEALNQLYRYKNEWHRKMALPFSIIIFFLIGAPLGAIIRKGGLGMPIIISVSFFVIYYIISISGEKMALEGTIGSFFGMWISAFILTPIAIFLTIKATNDSNLFDVDWYKTRYKKVKAFFTRPANHKKQKIERHGKTANETE
ncbi:MAG: LptF/LptG family permease [Rikenellaceae bacterium]|nr:LptF/LptG family permease [Rikenellaceae bacterium]